eukprot:1301405-Prymnesium_polylepis.2
MGSALWFQDHVWASIDRIQNTEDKRSIRDLGSTRPCTNRNPNFMWSKTHSPPVGARGVPLYACPVSYLYKRICIGYPWIRDGFAKGLRVCRVRAWVRDAIAAQRSAINMDSRIYRGFDSKSQ